MEQKDLTAWLTKAQAAEAIGVSTKTVEKFADDGLLHKETWHRPGKAAIVVYHPDDVQRERTKRQPDAPAFVVPDSNHEEPQESTALATRSCLYLTLKEASDLSGLSVTYLTRKIKAQELPAIKDVSWKIRRTELDKL